MSAIYVNDPANGESVSLSELGRRYGISAGCLSRRYHRGDRGHALIGQVSREELARAKAAEYREGLARQHRIVEANNAALMRPLNHIAQASKLVGGSQHV
ncbi:MULTISPECIES: helix-turn-helix domain-containing protein [unclassified Halomonas]|uniref:helix-turn-helix domain-containing protein n=1 Tax=unclassified Halomonas TaxID=2609666 RepID=UPI001EF73089|nr:MULTISPECIES: helix-turn-helix domain-containing protein [unclassified Halomonas]MCG7589714.1 hypothetical protein [Halomonas sp. McD50-5]MCG7616237.1 hypothetical protein [Halomonas sp. McD50-4]